MTILSKSLKAIAIILSLILTAGSTLIAIDAQKLASEGIIISDQGSNTTGSSVDLYLVIDVKNTGYFFDIYEVNLTILIIDDSNQIIDSDTEIVHKIPVGESARIELNVSIPIEIAMEWQNGTIKLYAKLYFVFWFGKYDYKLMKFGIVAKSEISGG